VREESRKVRRKKEEIKRKEKKNNLWSHNKCENYIKKKRKNNLWSHKKQITHFHVYRITRNIKITWKNGAQKYSSSYFLKCYFIPKHIKIKFFIFKNYF